ncbi:MAG TPA: M48 family metalloprotease [Rhizomicrobium sp.]|jgi:Zn-dependent protease with chaperone function|nr:M48 family metalloprotease [Rhizomicrobium sp.]
MPLRWLLSALPFLVLSTAALADAPVAIPPATEAALAYAQLHELIWGVSQLAMLALPLLLLVTGWGAKLRTACARLARGNRYATLTLFAAAYLILAALAVLPLDYWRDIASEPRFGRAGDPLLPWLLGEIVPLLVKIVAAALFLWIPYALIRRSPRRWWLYGALALIPVSFAILVALPVFIDPLTTDYHPLNDPKLAAQIEALAARCGVPHIPIFTGGDDDTVVGLGPTNRIILEDHIEKAETPAQIAGTIGHELKHYVMGDNYKALAIVAAILLVGFWLVDRLGRAAIARWHRRFSFADLADPASLPLIVVILFAFWLCVLPLFNWEARSVEHEADRFGLELTHSNRASAELYAGWAKGFPADYDAFFTVFRATHPSLADRIRFANTYKPWERGEKLVYGDICKPAG